ncbi:hypothetical protein DAI22_01g203000 [Oryza sativa Japonica Group]|nr:hypothetical protein DAI22_01g203000 [Oryza sativa Japonica Group]
MPPLPPPLVSRSPPTAPLPDVRRRSAGCGCALWADDLGPTGVVSAASVTATAAGRRETFSSGQIGGALAAGFRGEQVRLALFYS